MTYIKVVCSGDNRFFCSVSYVFSSIKIFLSGYKSFSRICLHDSGHFNVPLSFFADSLNHVLSNSCSWYTAVYACLLDNISFYATGHQPTIAGIPWDAAFVAFVGDHKTQWLPASMVLTNLYAGPILIASSLPLFILTRLYSTRAAIPFSLLRKEVVPCMNLIYWRFFISKSILVSGWIFFNGSRNLDILIVLLPFRNCLYG